MAKKEAGPSKSDLLMAIKSYEGYQSQALRKRRTDEENADRALDRFLAESKEYQKLKKLHEYAREICWDLDKQEKRDLQNELNKVRRAIFTKGVTPQTIRMVEELQEKYK